MYFTSFQRPLSFTPPLVLTVTWDSLCNINKTATSLKVMHVVSGLTERKSFDQNFRDEWYAAGKLLC